MEPSNKNPYQARPGTSLSSAQPLRVLAGVAIIAVTAFLAYFPSLSGGFLWVDDGLVTNNRLIRASDGLYRIWCTTEAVDYWPLTNSTFWIEWRLWGMNSTAYHVANLVLHIAAALLIWLILRKLSLPGAFLAALIFAVHPVNVQSVAWIAQRKNTLAMFFFLLSILWYLKQFSSSCCDNAQRSRHTPCAAPAREVCGLIIDRWYCLSLLAFVLAMLSKGSVAVLPLLLLGIVWWLRTGTVPIFAGTIAQRWSAKMGLSPSVSRWDLVRTAPFFLVAAVLTGVNVWFQTHGSGEEFRSIGFGERLLGAGGVVWFYLYKALLPLNLIFIYPQWHIKAANPLWWLPLAAALAITAVLWRYREDWSRPLMFAWGFFCVALLPVMGLTDVYFMKYSLVADHYQHIAIIGVIALAAACWSYWHQRARQSAVIIAAVLVCLLMYLTWQQSRMYKDVQTLYQTTIDRNPGCWLAYNNMGSGVMKAGRVEEAVKYFEQALRFNPDYVLARHNLGVAMDKLGRPREAIEHYRQALKINPNYAEAHNNLGIDLGKTGDVQEAIEHYRQALRLKPDYIDAHNNLGIILAQAGRPQEALEHFQIVLRLKPDFTVVYFNLALTYSALRQSSDAIVAAQKALDLARSSDQRALAKQVEDWLNAYRASLSN